MDAAVADPTARDVRARIDAHVGEARLDEIVTRASAPLVVVPRDERPDVSIVIVTYGTGPIVVDCLRALTDTLQSVAYEAVVVDQPVAGSDRGLGTASRLRLLTAGVRLVIADRNFGFGGGNDIGLARARAPIAVLLNPDAVVQPGWLAPLLGALDDPSVGIAAPVLLNPDRSVQEAGQTLDEHAITRPITVPPGEPVSPVTFASAACWALRRDDYARVGGFDPAYHPAYFEDVDLALRLERIGLRTVVVGASEVVHHLGRGSSVRTCQALDQQRVFRHRWGLQAG